MAYRVSMIPYYYDLVQFSFSPLIVNNAKFLYFIWKNGIDDFIFANNDNFEKFYWNIFHLNWPGYCCNKKARKCLCYQAILGHRVVSCKCSFLNWCMPTVSSKFYIENKIFYKTLPYRMNLFCPDNINQK